MKLALLIIRDTDLHANPKQRKESRGHSLKNVTQTEYLAFCHGKASPQSVCFCRTVVVFSKWHCFPAENCNPHYRESSVKTHPHAVFYLTIFTQTRRSGLEQSVKVGSLSIYSWIPADGSEARQSRLTGALHNSQDLAEVSAPWAKLCSLWPEETSPYHPRNCESSPALVSILLFLWV